MCPNSNIVTTILLLIFFCLQCVTKLRASDPDPIQDHCVPNILSNLTRCKNSSELTADDFIFSGMTMPGNFSGAEIASIAANPANFPGLNELGVSFARVDLKRGGINPPHSHPRATEIAHVIHGRVYSGFVDSTNRVFAKIMERGEVMVYPRGLIHFQMNVGEKHATIFGSFNSQNPGLMKIPSAVFGSGIDGELLEKAFGLNSKQIGKMRRKFDPESSED